MMKKYPRGFDVVPFKTFLEGEGAQLMREASNRSTHPPTQAKYTNEAFIKIAERFAKNKEGKGLNQIKNKKFINQSFNRSNWTFKKFF